MIDRAFHEEASVSTNTAYLPTNPEAAFDDPTSREILEASVTTDGGGGESDAEQLSHAIKRRRTDGRPAPIGVAVGPLTYHDQSKTTGNVLKYETSPDHPPTVVRALFDIMGNPVVVVYKHDFAKTWPKYSAITTVVELDPPVISHKTNASPRIYIANETDFSNDREAHDRWTECCAQYPEDLCHVLEGDAAVERLKEGILQPEVQTTRSLLILNHHVYLSLSDACMILDILHSQSTYRSQFLPFAEEARTAMLLAEGLVWGAATD